MKLYSKKVAALVLTAVLLWTTFLFGGCGKKDETPTPAKENQNISVGTFTMTGLNGETVTQDVFKKANITLVNVMATWCGPCVHELPELQKLYQKYKDRGLSVLVIVLDTVNPDGTQNDKAINDAGRLVSAAGVSFPMLMPTNDALSGKLRNIQSLPTTFFVDALGHFVGRPYVGAKNLDGWSAVVEKLLTTNEATK